MTAVLHDPLGEGLAVSSASTQVSDTSGWSRARRQIGTTASTPNVLLTSSIVVVALALAILAAAVGLASRTNDVSDRIVSTAGPLVVTAEQLHLALATADASASTAFLEAGLESADQRQRYEAALLEAGRAITSIADDPLDETTTDALSKINDNLTVYAGLVEAARANNRLGHPVGAAYLRDASDLMRSEILPAATDLFERAAERLADEYDIGRSRTELVVLLCISALTMVVLAVIQVFVARRSRRIVNLGLALATVAVVGISVASLVAFEAQRRQLEESQQRGADPLLVASASRILLLRTLNDENLDLIERGTDPAHMADFDAVRDVLGREAGAPGLISFGASASTASSVVGDYEEYLAIHEDVRRLVEEGTTDEAISMTVGPLADAERRLDERLSDTVAVAATRLDTAANDARDTSDMLLVLAVAFPVAGGVAALAGLHARRREYR